MAATELTPYPWPEGSVIPVLMPYQQYPWNNDPHIAAEVLRLKEAHGLTYAVETGTCLGSTALWLSEHFPHVATFEIHEPFYDIAVRRFLSLGKSNIVAEHLNSVDGIRIYANVIGPDERALYWLDAHWQDTCPLLDELEVIAQRGPAPVIVIHDMMVPGTDFGYDSMPDGRPFNLELIRHHLDAIYGEAKWWFNYPKEVAGAKRGWISIEPC